MKSSKTLRKPSNWQDFETLCKKLWGEIWNCKEIKKNGRLGQKQDGVDIYGIPEGEKQYYGIQCKKTKKLSEDVIEAEIENAKSFEPPLKKLYIATTANKDSNIEKFVRIKNIENIIDSFRIELFSWEDIVDLIDENEKTHNWYVKSKNYYSKNDVKVTFENDLDEINLSPIFEKQTTIYKQKTSQHPLLESYNILSQISNVSPTFPTKTNHSFSFFRLKIKNMGKEPIEDYKLKLEFEGDIFEIDETNQKGGFNLTPIYKDYQMDWDNKKLTVEIRPDRDIRTLVSDDFFISPEIFFIPNCNENCTIFLKWELLSRYFRDDGKLAINICPKIQTVNKKEYIEDSTKIGKKEEFRYYITED